MSLHDGEPRLVVKVNPDTSVGVAKAALLALFPGDAPQDWDIVVSGLLAVLESFVLGQTSFRLIESELRSRWEHGPYAAQVSTGMSVLSQFSSAEVMRLEAEIGRCGLIVRLTGPNGRSATLAWTTKQGALDVVRTLNSVRVHRLS